MDVEDLLLLLLIYMAVHIGILLNKNGDSNG
jgi:hypothetical protein